MTAWRVATAAMLTMFLPMAVGQIRFAHRSLPFTLENGETFRRHMPETMAGGVAMFDYDGDGDLDLYFANGAEMPSLEKTSPKYWNRLYANDGEAHFVDVTQESGVSGQGYSTATAVAD